MANNQEKSKELIIFYKKNNILYLLFLRNLGFFVTFAGKYNISMKHSIGIITLVFQMTNAK